MIGIISIIIIIERRQNWSNKFEKTTNDLLAPQQEIIE